MNNNDYFIFLASSVLLVHSLVYTHELINCKYYKEAAGNYKEPPGELGERLPAAVIVCQLLQQRQDNSLVEKITSSVIPSSKTGVKHARY